MRQRQYLSTSEIVLFFGVLILGLDSILAALSTRGRADFAWLELASLVLYVVAGYVAARYSTLGAGVRAGASVALIDATVELGLMVLMGYKRSELDALMSLLGGMSHTNAITISLLAAAVGAIAATMIGAIFGLGGGIVSHLPSFMRRVAVLTIISIGLLFVLNGSTRTQMSNLYVDSLNTSKSLPWLATPTASGRLATPPPDKARESNKRTARKRPAATPTAGNDDEKTASERRPAMRPKEQAYTSELPAGLGGPVYFVPLGDFPLNTLRQLASEYRRKYGLKVRLLAALPLPKSALDRERNRELVKLLKKLNPPTLEQMKRAGVDLEQGSYRAEELITFMQTGHPEHAVESNAVMIGFTNRDIYRVAAPNTAFYFASRSPETRTAVVSSARMKLLGGMQSRRLFESRLRKMTTKQIGLLYYDFSLSNDPRSVLYADVRGLEDLDRIGEDLRKR